MNFGRVFKRFRLIRGKSVEDISGYLGLSVDAYCQWESGEKEPDLEQLGAMAQYYNCSVDFLLDMDELKSSGRLGF